jgi:hypothetical protein
MGIGEQDTAPQLVEFVDWDDLYNRVNDDEAVVEGLAYRGRWTALASAAKAGKSTFLLGLAVETATAGMTVMYLDAEMGRGDVLERVEDWMGLKPSDLVNLRYTDLPPKLDNVAGAQALWDVAEELGPDIVIIDGLNGVVNGAENDDTTWRDMYEWAIAPLKARNVAIVSADNTGKDRTLGPRGSSVKLDKADAVLILERTDTGVTLIASHRRSTSYPREQEYIVTDADESGPPMRVVRVDDGSGVPEGTARVVAILDNLGAPLDISRRTARRLLAEHGFEGVRNAEFGAMLAWRRANASPPLGGSRSTGPRGTTGPQGKRAVPVVGNHFEKVPDKTGWSSVPQPPPSYEGGLVGTSGDSDAGGGSRKSEPPTAEDVGL